MQGKADEATKAYGQAIEVLASGLKPSPDHIVLPLSMPKAASPSNIRSHQGFAMIVAQIVDNKHVGLIVAFCGVCSILSTSWQLPMAVDWLTESPSSSRATQVLELTYRNLEFSKNNYLAALHHQQDANI